MSQASEYGIRRIVPFLVSFLLFSGCDNTGPALTGFVDPQVAESIEALPLEVPTPALNPFSESKRELGRLLFWDPVLSGTMDVSCASCHHPDFGYADGRQVSQGVFGVGLGPTRTGGHDTQRNSPTVLNTAFNGIMQDGGVDPATAPMFWDLRAASLEEQAIQPILNADEMRGPVIAEEAIMDTVIARLEGFSEYVTRFEDAFGTSEINMDRIAQAIATYERSLVANNSRFDQFMRGDDSALSNQEIAGMNAFVSAGCADCHSGPMMSDFEVHTLGVPEAFSGTDTGTNRQFDFRTPTLRNVTLTGPYMHNGVFENLEEVMDFYEDVAEGDNDELHSLVSRADLDPEMLDLSLDDDQVGDIMAFLHTLTDDSFDRTRPSAVPSGLSPGGF